jgi:hypothetical protein
VIWGAFAFPAQVLARKNRTASVKRKMTKLEKVFLKIKQKIFFIKQNVCKFAPECT